MGFSMFQEFKKFIIRGNTVDLAVAVVVGGAFGAIVSTLVKDIITPLIGAIGGNHDFSRLSFTINGSQFLYGNLINAMLSFLLIATVVFFLVVQPVNKLVSLAAKSKDTDEPNTKKCPECLSEIPKAAMRCAHCTSKLKV